MPYCKALYNHLFVNVQGFYGPCCHYEYKKQINYKEKSWIDFHKSDYMENIRSNMKNGWDPGCRRCETREKNSLKSGRDHMNFFCKSNSPVIEYIEISASNNCNIRCRMCGPEFSSKWAETLTTDVSSIDNFKNFLSSIPTKDLKIIKYLGGEPFITPQIKILFDWMLTLPNKVAFHCNSNLTLFPKKYIETMSKFHSIRIGYSIDGIGLVNDYIRQDSKWDIILDNFLQWEDLKKQMNIISYVHTTIQAYNFHDLKNLKNFCDTHKLYHNAYHLQGPEEFTFNSLPEEYVLSFTNDYNRQFIKNYKYNKSLHDKLRTTTIRNDNLLGTSINNYIPELSQWI